ncbi:MAG: hypothetical protein Q7R35_08460 [Elusimicrobiota bacterium]|nr:hypothetical protein [Elusimicrobiota bacterium]
MRRGFWLIGPFWAIGISAYIMFAPMVKSVSVSRSLSPDHRSIQTAPDYSSMSWYETKGLSAARPLVIPILLAFLPLVIPNTKTRRIVGAISIVLLASFCALTAFSVGSYYMPSVAALLAALFVEYYYEKKAKQVDGKANHI